MRELRHSARMVGMRMRIENPFDVAQIDAEIPNVPFDQCGIPRHTAINQHIACTCSDQEDAESTRADVPGIAINAKWLLRSRPRRILRDVLLLRQGHAKRRLRIRTARYAFLLRYGHFCMCTLHDQTGSENRSHQQAHGQFRYMKTWVNVKSSSLRARL